MGQEEDMDPNRNNARPPLTTYEALAKMIDHSLVRPELTDEQVLRAANSRSAITWPASVCGPAMSIWPCGC